MLEVSTINDAGNDDGLHEDEGERGADPTAEFLGRRVIQSFNTAWFSGTVTGFSDGRYQVTCDDGEIHDITRTELTGILHNANGASHRETAEWQILRNLYDETQEAVARGTFTPTEEYIR